MSTKLSDLINQLTEMWWNWMKYHNISQNSDLSIETRAMAVRECEKLINLEYELTEKIDEIFIQCQKKNN